MWRREIGEIAGATEQAPGLKKAANVVGSDRRELEHYFTDNGAADFSFYEGMPKSNWTLGEAKVFDMPIVARIIERLTLLENANIMTQILPIVRTNSLKLQYETVTFLPTIAQRTAERAFPRTVENKRSQIRAVLERSAIGMELNYAMLTTPLGQEYYREGLGQMRRAVEEANSLNILNTIENCFSPWRKFEDRYARFRGRSMRDIMEEEKFYFGIFQRKAGAFQLLDSHSRRCRSSTAAKVRSLASRV